MKSSNKRGLTVVESVWLMAIVSLIGAVVQPYVESPTEPTVPAAQPTVWQFDSETRQPVLRMVRSTHEEDSNVAIP